MKKIYFPKSLTIKYYDSTIESNASITPDGFYDGPEDDAYNKSREELRNKYEMTFLCDEWLDFFCFQERYSSYSVPVADIMKLVERYFEQTIPLGCLLIAIKHRREKHKVSPDGKNMELIISKRIYDQYMKIVKYTGGFKHFNQQENNVIKCI